MGGGGKNTPFSTCRSPMCPSAQGVMEMSANFSLLRHKVGQRRLEKNGGGEVWARLDQEVGGRRACKITSIEGFHYKWKQGKG